MTKKAAVKGKQEHLVTSFNVTSSDDPQCSIIKQVALLLPPRPEKASFCDRFISHDDFASRLKLLE